MWGFGGVPAIDYQIILKSHLSLFKRIQESYTYSNQNMYNLPDSGFYKASAQCFSSSRATRG
jgi:hypothetical protein